MVMVARVWFLALDLDASFASDRLMEAVDQRRPGMSRPVNSSTMRPRRPSPRSHVAFEERVGLERLRHVVEHVDLARVVEVRDRQALALGDALLGSVPSGASRRWL